ncbi:DNA topoisomerase [Salinivibrio sp. MA351]|uniref:DNA topoisomerase family protein n=1 Tax=unclassified Salinivibrio TaxID=2636825 RepID=UPI000395C7CD|nr:MULTISPECIES: type I DNA topoisomerase [unclassified Salinivibrio]NUY57597.1 topoisomerase DNA-binding C4 zinc finger domain-containing protein [Salinivibrio sp. EAGSL]OOE89930.1 DNA topoisomerase [Salinivibrio sp. AR647]OOE91901.1 DNA topoisomerase [Salinivibrio sp. AR640]OOE97532.1 DNA topoisomerase [Salinivibrio sp. MA351]OOF19965.1 DNA topoisomerase [Salinivibrio sp. MA427]
MNTDNTPKTQERCPECGSALAFKSGKRGPFLACTAYPDCHYTKALHHGDGHVVKALGVTCPACQQGELVLRQGRFGMFIGCDQFPQCTHIEKPDEPDHTTLTCPACHKGELVERTSRYGKRFFACDQYPKCHFAVNAQPIAGTCEACGFALLVERKKGGKTVHQCADKPCSAIQDESAAESESED